MFLTTPRHRILLIMVWIEVTFVTRGSSILADALTIILTWVKTFGLIQNAKKSHMQYGVAGMIFRDGESDILFESYCNTISSRRCRTGTIYFMYVAFEHIYAS